MDDTHRMDASLQRPNPNLGRLSPERLESVQRFVAARLSEPIHVEDLAAVAGLSPFHFSRMFHAATGKAPHAYVTACRMDKAKRLLAETDLALAKVATEVGYRTQAHFTGVFHRHVGVTPRTYRLSMQGRTPRAAESRAEDSAVATSEASSARATA